MGYTLLIYIREGEIRVIRIIREVRVIRVIRELFGWRFGGFKKKPYLCAQ